LLFLALKEIPWDGHQMVGIDFILWMFTAYLNQYKNPFTIPFQHLKFMVSLCKQFKYAISTQISYYNYYFFCLVLFLYLNKICGQNIVRFIGNPKHNRYKI
jgi:hypothetical protein